MITNIRLKNFKCFDELDIDVSNLTLFMGINGVGKSTVIQSLLLQRQSLYDRRGHFSDKVIFDGDLVNLRNAQQTKYILADDDEIGIGYTDDDVDYTTIIDVSDDAATTSPCSHSDNYEDMISKSSLFADSFAYLYADRSTPKDIYSRIASSTTDSRLGDRSGHLTASYLLKSLKNSDLRDVAISDMALSEDDKSLLSNTSLWLSNIMSSSEAVGVSERSDNEVSLYYKRPSETIGSFNVSPLNMPFGNSYLLPIIVGILSAPKGSLFIVENPEAHLHPSAQTLLGVFLAKAAHLGVQIFVETHSDHLVNGIRKSVKDKVIQSKEVSLHFISESEVNPMIHLDDNITIHEDGGLDKWPSHFLDEWERSMYDLSK